MWCYCLILSDKRDWTDEIMQFFELNSISWEWNACVSSLLPLSQFMNSFCFSLKLIATDFRIWCSCVLCEELYSYLSLICCFRQYCIVTWSSHLLSCDTCSIISEYWGARLNKIKRSKHLFSSLSVLSIWVILQTLDLGEDLLSHSAIFQLNFLFHQSEHGWGHRISSRILRFQSSLKALKLEN